MNYAVTRWCSVIYAVIGTKLFRDRRPEYFQDFSTSLFTMFQVCPRLHYRLLTLCPAAY